METPTSLILTLMNLTGHTELPIGFEEAYKVKYEAEIQKIVESTNLRVWEWYTAEQIEAIELLYTEFPELADDQNKVNEAIMTETLIGSKIGSKISDKIIKELIVEFDLE